MSYSAHHKEFGAFVEGHPKRKVIPKKRDLLRRIVDGFRNSHQRNLDRQIARFLAARSGGKLTDSLELEISQRLLTSNWRVNAEPFNDRRFP